MVRRNRTYGTTNAEPLPPPPYSGFAQLTDIPYPNQWTPLNQPDPPQPNPPSKRDRIIQILGSRWSSILLTFVVTVGLCMVTMPITYCNDPADPRVRERIREEWSKDLLEHEKQAAQREITKARWAWEDEQHEKLVREWEEERIEHDRELKERARREEEERRRLRLFWGHVETHGCKTYGTREYTALLMNLPVGWDRRVEACRATPLEIHGISYLPKSCEDRGGNGMIGRWEVDQQEPDCVSFWDSYNDKGCTSPGSRKKYITCKLRNIPEHGDWREFCATTPVHFDGMEFQGAHECIDSVWGIYGQWEIADGNC